MKTLCLFCIFMMGMTFIYADYHFDRCVELNGPNSPQNQYIQLNNEPLYDFSGNFTIEFWLNVREWTINNQAIITKGAGTTSGWGLERLGTTNNIRVWWGDYPYWAIIDLNFVNQWHHLAIIRSSNNFYVYIDGNQVFQQKIWSIANNYPLLIGENAAFPGRYLHGKVDELRIWNTSRTQEQLLLNRYNRLQSTESGLITYLRLDDNSSTLVDATAHTTCTFFNYNSDVWQDATQLEESYVSDKSYDFFGSNPLMRATNLWTSSTTQFTAEAWINTPDPANPTEVILNYKSRLELSISNGQIGAHVYLSDASSVNMQYNGIKPNQWYHLAVSIDTNGLCALYINGWLAHSVMHSGAGISAPGVNDMWSIGNSAYGGMSFNGKIDQVRIWNRALSAGEIWEFRHQENPVSTNGLLANYQFNETSMRVIFNQAGSINCVTNDIGTKIDSTWPMDQYYFGGYLNENTVLPVRTVSVWSDILIPSAKKLTVNPGTTLSFIGNYGIVAEGSLQAIGSEASPIVFTVPDTSGWSQLFTGTGCWNGLAVLTTAASDSTIIDHCVLKYGKASLTGVLPPVGGQSPDLGVGGAVFIQGTSRVRLSHSLLDSNMALVGGAVFSDSSYVVLTGNVITNNYSYLYGGGAVFDGGIGTAVPGTILNNVIASNRSDLGGGIVFKECFTDPGDPSTDRFRNNTIADNQATTSGGGVYYLGGSTIRARNSIVWGNTAPNGSQVYLENGCAPEFRYCNIQAGVAGFGGTGAGTNYSGAYDFCADSDPEFMSEGAHSYNLKPWSGCINRGEADSALSEHDLRGEARVYLTSGSINPQVDAILNRVDLGAYEDQIGRGVVPYDLTFSGLNSMGTDLTIPHGTALTVSSGTELNFAPQTGISIYGSLQAVGMADGGWISFTAQNEALGWEGLAFLGENTPVDNSHVTYCKFSHGKAVAGDQLYGGLIHVDTYDSLIVSNCVLSHGTASKGGALAVFNSSAEFYSSELHHNTATSGGSAIYVEDADPLLAHLTIADNGEGAIQAVNSGYSRLFGCNIWNNGAIPISGTMIALYCNVQGGYPGSSNISVDPRFDPSVTDHYLLLPVSPCMNKGIPDPGFYPNLPAFDIVGNPRVHAHTQSIYNCPDIGAHEYPGLMDPTDFSATDGNNNYAGHVYLSWSYADYYLPNNGFQIFRDGSMLVTLYPHITSYADYSAIPGQQHSYTLLAYAGGELSNPITDIGYIKPNGIITGKVQTPNSNPVSGVSVSLSPSSGYCLQFGTGSYFEVAAPDANLSASFTLESWMKTAETDCALIYKLDPGDSDLKQLRLNAMGKLLYTDGSSSLIQTNDSLLVGDNDWHHIAMVYDAFAATGRLYLDGICVAESALTLLDTPGGSLHVDNSSGFAGFIDDIRLWNTARSAEEIQNLMSLIPAWNSPGLIGYWAMNEGNGSQGFDATNHAHIAIINAAWSTNEPGIMLGGVTDNWGEYVISQIPYGNYTTFTVTPSKPGHMFQPEQRLVTLSISNIGADNVDFIDNSMIPISGHVTFYGTICPVEGATIWLNGAQAVPLILTDAEGYYVLEVEHGTDCLVSVNYKSHTFDREWDLGVVTYPRTNINFQDTFTTDLFVQVVGGADSYPLGEFNVSLNSVNGLYNREVTGQEWYTGMILIPYIPPLDFNVTVNPAGADPFDLAINDQFQSLKTAHLNLSDADTIADTLRYEWRAPLQVEVAWPPELELKYFATDPGHQYGFYVIEQNEWIELPIRSFEDYTISGYPERRSFLTHCEIEITDEVGAIRDTEDDFGGEEIYTYQFAPYLPNILDGGERPYQNMLQVTLHDPLLNRFASQTDWVITRGVKPTESTFATTSPEIPFLILHDPPGDASYASFRQSSSSSMAMSISYSSARDDGRQVVSHLGPDIVSDIGILYSVQTSFDFTLDIGYGYSCRVTQGDAFETCLTFTSTEEYQTSDQGMLIGRESDLYVGGALNLIWGLTREVVWNDTTQTVSVQDNVMVVPDGFATIYMYTEAQILNNVIPNLITIGDTNSAEMWQSYVEMNTDNIANAVSNPNHPANVSFNAGAGYLYEETASRSSTFTHTFEQVTSEEFGLDAGLVINGLGVTGGFSFEAAVTIGNSQSLAYDTDTTIRYELADNDETSYLNYQPDYFTVDIRTDPVFGTPVFNLLAGASSNRWEQHTLPRDGVNISANTYTATGLQEGETAAFLLNLGNTSQTGEYRRYFLCLKHETNPHGAVILINGLPVTDRIPFNIPPGEQVQAVMTIAQGPYAYEYEGITLELYAEGDRGNPGPNGHYFWMTKAFNVYWEPPYSRVSIAYPEDNWIISQESENQMLVMLRDYDLDKPDFSSLLLQYKRPSDPDWLPALEIVRDSLLAHPQSIVVAWDVSALSDGFYQLRAGTTDNIQPDYYAASLSGTIDRSSPEVWGLPQPADGILNLGDLIEVSFNEDIDPESVLPGCVSLIVLRNMMAVDVNVQVNGSAVSIVPLIPNYWLENETLQVTIQGLTDCYGNPLFASVVWEFFVNANPVYWMQPKIEVIKALGETLIVSAQLHNSGGQISSFTLSDISEWLTASVSSGSLLPLETKTIVFTISNQLGYGTFRDTIYADIPALGRESLVFEIRVLADPPAWASTQLSNFDYSMTITGQLFIEGEISHDPNDIIGAFIWDPASQNYLCRGVAALTGVPWLPDSHQFFLTIYSYADAGEELFFRVWDSSTNKEHFGIQEEFSFISGLVYGTPLIPVVIHVSPELYSSINCNAGWNWLSMNLNNTASMSVNSMLASLNPAAGDIVKNQTSYAQFIPTLGWIGSLNTISTVESYKLKLTNPGALNLTGLLEDPITTPIPYGSGWNWIGYLPHVSISVNQALEHIPNAITGDIIKSQSGYSQYIAGYGWFGSMLFMNPGKGYMLKTVNSGSFHYPQYTIPREKPVDTYALDLEKLRQPTSWNVNPLAYEYSSNITAVILDNGMPLVEPNALLAAFYGDECRGLASPVWVIDKWVFFLTQYSNVMNQMLNYKVYFADSGDIFSLAETLPFVNNQVLGDPLAPFEFHLGAADLPIPQNLLMQVSPGSLILSWDGCNGADTYKVFASDDPHGIYVDVTSQGVLGRGLMPLGSGTDVIADPDLNLGPPALRFRITWTCDLPVTNRKFYQVKAVIQRQDK